MMAGKALERSREDPAVPNIVLLNNIDHAGLTVATGHGAAYGDAVNQTLVFPTEWEEVQREYPILFRRDDEGRFYAVALLGLDRDENLFLGDGVWDGRYVPALHQRGPFSIGVPRGQAEGEPMIHVDLDHPRIGSGAGQAVFLPHGGNSPYLEAMAAVLRNIHAGAAMTRPLFEALDAAELVQPIALEVSLDETRRYVIDDVFTIAGERLAALDGPALAALHARGFLQPAFWALSSLGNVARLIDRKNRR